MSKTTNKYSPEVRERAVRMVLDNQSQHDSRWSAILSISAKIGCAPDINTFVLGQHGRYRTDVWQYKGVNTLKAGRMDELSLHPTVKPVR